METSVGNRLVWGFKAVWIMVVACSSILLIAANATPTGGVGTDSVSGIELSNLQLSKVNEISAFQRTLPSAAAPTGVALDGVDTAMKQASKLEHDRVSDSNPHVMGIWQEAKGDGENKDEIRMERLLRFSDYVDPMHHPPQEPPSLIDP